MCNFLIGLLALYTLYTVQPSLAQQQQQHPLFYTPTRPTYPAHIRASRHPAVSSPFSSQAPLERILLRSHQLDEISQKRQLMRRTLPPNDSVDVLASMEMDLQRSLSTPPSFGSSTTPSASIASSCLASLFKITIREQDLDLIRAEIHVEKETHHRFPMIMDPDLYFLISHQIQYSWQVVGGKRVRRKRGSYLLIVNTSGSIVGAHRWPYRVWTPKILNCSIIYMLMTLHDIGLDYKYNASFFLWNSAATSSASETLHRGTADRSVRLDELGIRNRILFGATHDVHYDAETDRVYWVKCTLRPGLCRLGKIPCISKELVSDEFISEILVSTNLNNSSGQSDHFHWDSVQRLLDPETGLRSKFDSILKFNRWRDFSHFNSLMYVHSEKAVYVNSRSLNTVYKIDVETGKVMWGVGQHGTLRLLDESGHEAPFLFKMAHGVHLLSPTSILLFDNEFRIPKICGTRRTSRLVEIQIDVDSNTARSVWSWSPQRESDCGILHREVGGGCFRLRSNHRMGLFGRNPSQRLVVVDPTGQETLRIKIAGSFVYDAVPFYATPKIELLSREAQTLIVRCFDAIYSEHTRRGTLRVTTAAVPGEENPTAVVEKAFEFQPFWNPTIVTVELPAFSSLTWLLTVINQDGVQASIPI